MTRTHPRAAAAAAAAGRPPRRPAAAARRAPLVAVAAALASALAAVPAAADVRTVEPATAFRRQVERITRHTDVAVLLPARVRIDAPRRHGIEATWSANRRGWDLSLGIGPRCGGANACFVGSFGAVRGGRPALRATVRLRGGITGHYKGLTCGASCSPPMIEWVSDGALYTIQFREAGRGSDRAKLVRLANSALAAGPR